MYYYKQVKDGNIVSIEAKSGDAISPNFAKATKAEYDSFMASLPEPEPPEPVRDLAKEMDGLKERILDLENK